jgi:3-mercaptopyruvate sulfurtransferase SseA
MSEPEGKKSILRGVPLKALGWSWLQAAILVAFSVAVALFTNWLRGPRGGGLPLRRKAPFDIFTDCPEILDDLPMVKVSRLPTKSKGVIYVDARKAPSFCKGHIPRAWFLPMYETEPPNEETVSRLKKKRGRWIVICGDEEVSSGKRLATALVNKGVRGVRVLEGGIGAWKKAGRPIKRCDIPEISVKAAGEAGGSMTFVDAQTEEGFGSKHIPEAVSIPYDDLLPPDPRVLRALRARKIEAIVVYDSGEPTPEGEVSRGWGVAAQLKARGFGNVKVMSGGLKKWIEAGSRVETAPGENEKSGS